jgi:hypothetical protein
MNRNPRIDSEMRGTSLPPLNILRTKPWFSLRGPRVGRIFEE